MGLGGRAYLDSDHEESPSKIEVWSLFVDLVDYWEGFELLIDADGGKLVNTPHEN
jgi:hypothetical protein